MSEGFKDPGARHGRHLVVLSGAGISAESVRVQLMRPEVKGAVLELWGSGNLPEDGELLGVLADARGEGKLLVLNFKTTMVRIPKAG